MYYNAPLLYEQAYSITINNADAPLYYFFDYDERSYNINMEFQHFHQFYEVHILLEARRLISSRAIITRCSPMISCFCARRCCTKRSIPWARRASA